MTNLPTLIAGGGIAGLASALAVANAGGDAVVLEREERFGEGGAGLQLGPNAVTALRKLGAWDAVAPITSQPPEIHLRDGRSGKLLKRIRLAGDFEKRYGAPYRVAHRAALHGQLLALCQANSRISLHVATALATFRQTGSQVIVNDAVHGHCLIAADGVHSPTRKLLVPGSAAIDSGFVFHRAFQHCGSTSDIALDCVNVWMLPGAHVVHYPVGQDHKLNLVCITAQQETVQKIVARSSPVLGALLEQMTFAPWPGLMAPALPRWHFDRVTLVGDAAHGTLPFLAQGAAMALEDAAALTIAKHEIWQVPAKRMDRTQRLHRATLSAGRTYHLAGTPAFVRNLALSLLPATYVMSRLDWIYAHRDTGHR